MADLTNDEMQSLKDDYLQSLKAKLPNAITESDDFLNFESALRSQSPSQGSFGQLFNEAIKADAFIAGERLLLYAGKTDGATVIGDWKDPQSKGFPADVYTAAQTPMNNALDNFLATKLGTHTAATHTAAAWGQNTEYRIRNTHRRCVVREARAGGGRYTP